MPKNSSDPFFISDDYADCVLTRTLFVSATPTAESSVGTSDTTANLTFSPSGSTDSTTYYDWTATTMPSGASAPTFSDDDDASASSTIATFSQAGDYTIVVTEADSSGVVETATFPVTVDQSLGSIYVMAPLPTLAEGYTEQLTATAFDQFGNPFTLPTGSVTWSAPSGVTIDSDGYLTAPSTVEALSITASATVVTDSHSYTANGSAVVQIITATTEPTISVSGDSTVNNGMPYMLNLPAIAPSGAAITSWSIDWGDDSTENISTPIPSAVPHVYASSGKYTITATATDADDNTFTTTENAGTAGAFDSGYTPSLPGSGSFEAVAALPDGGVVVGGTNGTGAVLASFYADGSSDTNFVTTSSDATEIRAVGVQPLYGSFVIIAAGTDSTGAFYLDCYSLSGSYEGNLAATSPFTGEQFRPDAMAIAADDSIYVAGYLTSSGATDLAVVHYLANGTLDTNFGSGGVATAGITADPTYRCGMAIDAEGNIVVAGTAGYPDPSDSSTTYDEFAIVRFASGGWLDSTFGNNGVVLDASGPGNYNYATAVAIQSDGGVVVAGRSTGYGLDLVRYLPDGTEDPNFQNWNASGLTAAAVNSVVIQPNNMILVGGSFGSDGKFGVARFNVDGTLNTTFNSGYGFVTNGTAGSAADGLVIQPDGSVIAAGAWRARPCWPGSRPATSVGRRSMCMVPALRCRFPATAMSPRATPTRSRWATG